MDSIRDWFVIKIWLWWPAYSRQFWVCLVRSLEDWKPFQSCFVFCHQLWNKKFSSLWFCSSCYICFYWTDVHHRLIACFVHLCLATICTWDLLSNSNDWISNNDAWENPKAVYVYNKICTVKSRALDRSTIQFWTLWAKDHSTYASNFTIINSLQMLGCATNQDSLLLVS